MARDILARIQAKTIIDGDCWRYAGQTFGTGYGIVRYKNRKYRVARIVCCLFYGKDLNDKTWYAYRATNCKHYDCWKPSHLRPDNKATGGWRRCSAWKRQQELEKDHSVLKRIEDTKSALLTTHSRSDMS